MRLVQQIPIEPWANVPAEVRRAYEQRYLEEVAFQAVHGKGRRIITAALNDWRFVAVGNEVHFAKSDRTPFFTDFLSRYLRQQLGHSWGEAQLKKPEAEQHQVIKWFRGVRDLVKSLHPTETGNRVAFVPTGVAIAWFQLAYDVYLIKHNTHLQRRIIERIKNPAQFQGARFELAVTAGMVTAGYEIDYENEGDLSRKHAEFKATHPSGWTVAVEAKSRHRQGVLGFNSPGAKITDKVAVESILRDALAKDPPMPYFIFVDVNLPPSAGEPSEEHPWWREMHETEKNIQAEWEPGTFPANALFFCNDASHYALNEKFGNKNPAWCFEVPGRQPRNALHESASMEVARAMLLRTNIPQHFPEDR